MSQVEAPIVVGLGELLWDCFADTRRPGGAPANVAFQACQLGCQGIVCSRVGRDDLGDQLIDFLAGQGLATDWIQRDARYATGTVCEAVCFGTLAQRGPQSRRAIRVKPIACA